MQKTILSVLMGLLFFMEPTAAGARENKADVAGYCIVQFGPTAFANIDQRDNGLLCSVRTDGGLGLTHNKVKAADVCAKQYGTRRFRRDGQDVICLKGSGNTTAQAGRSIDLEKYCRKTYGADAFATVRRTDNAPMCSIRTDGGLGLRHYIIDIAGLCGGSAPRSDAKTLYCGGGTAGGATPPSGDTAGSGAPASPANGAATPSNGQRPTTPAKDQTSIVAKSCQSLGGKWRSGTLSLVDQIKSDMDQKVSRRTPALSTAACAGQQRILCLRSIGAVISDAYMNTIMIWQCHLAVIQDPRNRPGDDVRLALDEACAINKRLDQLADQLIATNLYRAGAMDPPIHTRLLKARKMTGFCQQEYVEDEM